MAKELDAKSMNTGGFDGQISFGDDEFYNKYETRIELLTDKFMPAKESDQQKWHL